MVMRYYSELHEETNTKLHFVPNHLVTLCVNNAISLRLIHYFHNSCFLLRIKRSEREVYHFPPRSAKADNARISTFVSPHAI
jgi:hypothetical protein